MITLRDLQPTPDESAPQPPELSRPLSGDLQRYLDETIAQIPSTGKGFAEVQVGRPGVSAEIGATLSARSHVAAFGSLSWSGQWTAGARARVTW